ncbi:uncharacterized protein [Haliotis cracherodii]|uniref:uncharacterized protein n=1 Tax=Haliotis cracherodii TaxID=6455 RepID=UPI0039E82EDC
MMQLPMMHFGCLVAALLLTFSSVESGRGQDVKDLPRVADDVNDVSRDEDVDSLARVQFDKDLLDEYCEDFRAAVAGGQPGCGKDQRPHCLANGSVVLGSCRLKRAVCLENVLEDFDWFSCAIQ